MTGTELLTLQRACSLTVTTLTICNMYLRHFLTVTQERKWRKEVDRGLQAADTTVCKPHTCFAEATGPAREPEPDLSGNVSVRTQRVK